MICYYWSTYSHSKKTLMCGSLKASATNKYHCLVILEALQSVSGSPKIRIFRGMAQWKRGVFPPPPPPLHYTTQLRHAKRRSSLDLTYWNLLTFLLLLLLKLVENPVLFRGQTTMRLCWLYLPYVGCCRLLHSQERLRSETSNVFQHVLPNWEEK